MLKDLILSFFRSSLIIGRRTHHIRRGLQSVRLVRSRRRSSLLMSVSPNTRQSQQVISPSGSGCRGDRPKEGILHSYAWHIPSELESWDNMGPHKTDVAAFLSCLIIAAAFLTTFTLRGSKRRRETTTASIFSMNLSICDQTTDGV